MPGPPRRRQYKINLKTNQLRRKLLLALRLSLRKSVLESDTLSLDPTKPGQLLAERLCKDRATGFSACIQETYPEDFPCLLRVGGANSMQKGSNQ
jgi:hypothetical protein